MGEAADRLQVVPSIGATYWIYALLVQQWGIGGIRSFPHGSQDEEPTAAAPGS